MNWRAMRMGSATPCRDETAAHPTTSHNGPASFGRLVRAPCSAPCGYNYSGPGQTDGTGPCPVPTPRRRICPKSCRPPQRPPQGRRSTCREPRRIDLVPPAIRGRRIGPELPIQRLARIRRHDALRHQQRSQLTEDGLVENPLVGCPTRTRKHPA